MCNGLAHNTRKRRESLGKRKKSVALAVRVRDRNACVYCSATKESSGAHLHLDHIVPKSKGGKDIEDNLVLSCRRCNSRRKEMPFDAWCRSIGREDLLRRVS